jgi:hypothetical protein
VIELDSMVWPVGDRAGRLAVWWWLGLTTIRMIVKLGRCVDDAEKVVHARVGCI